MKCHEHHERDAIAVCVGAVKVFVMNVGLF